MDYETMVMQLVTNGGTARSCAMQAIEKAKEGAYEEARELLRAADSSIGQAHQYQTELIQDEVRGNAQQVTLLIVHAQDHIMNAMVVIDMAKEFVALYETINS